MELTLHIQDKMKLYSKSFLSMHHIQIVNLLYQPIIGQDTINLYITLWNLFQMDKRELILTHAQLLTFFNWDLIHFLKNREKLESIGLLYTYYHKSEGYYLYELKQPITAKQYFQDSNLNVHLLYVVGENMYEYLEEKFMIKDIDKNFVNISKTFEYSFTQLQSMPNMMSEHQYISSTVNNFEIPLNYDFDYELFSILVGRSFINVENIDKKTKAAIIKEAALYHFDAQMMSKIVLECEINQEIDLTILHDTARRYYKRLKTNKTRNDLKKPMTKQQFDEQMNKDNLSLKEAALKNYKTKTPQQWLSILQNNTEVPSSMLEVVRILFDEYKLSSEVINVLIEFVRTRNDGRLPLEYTKAIASSWAFKKIKTAEEAMNFIDLLQNKEKEYTKPNNKMKKQSRSTKRVVDTPSWMKETPIDKNIDEKNNDAAELTDLKDLLASFK